MHGMKWLRDALFAPTTLSTSISCLFLLLVFAPPRPLILVNAQVGFISIDCGAPQESTSGNISWTPDGTYTLSGSNANASGTVPPYDTLRYFPDKRFNKSCYVFNTTVSMSYLIRAGFFYGNYDNQFDIEGLPKFVLLFGANLWTNVTFNDVNETVTHEMIALATSNTTSVCLGRSITTNHNPFISSLEVRPLSTNQKMYSPVHGNFLMKSNSRINFGQKTDDVVRYPDDDFDRIWESDMRSITGITTYNTTVTTNMSVSAASSDDLPPSKVMQTARSPNKTESMSFNFFAKLGPGQYYLAFYFAELDNNTSQRIMDLYIDGNLRIQALNIFDLRGSYKSLEVFYKNYTVTDGNYTLLLMPNNSLTRAPIINAAESYLLQKTIQSTFELDVQALEIIKSAFNLSTSMGDPCLPSVYKWAWLECDNSSQARVIALNLSSMDLHSEIPSAVAVLSALSKVDFHNNSLFGSVPLSLASLRNLTFLDLSNNNLSGEFPVALKNLTDYRISGNPSLCISDSCDAAPAPAPAPTTALVPPRSSSTRLTRLLVGVLLAVTIVVVGAMLGFILHKRKSQKRKLLFGVHSAHWPPVPPFTEISKAVDPGVAIQKGGSDDVPIYSFDDIKIITNNFENKINAAGGFGTLFYGTLSDGQEVAVKLLQSNIDQTPIEFLYKVTPLSHVNHKNLLRPIGFCAEKHRLMFVYGHVQKGSLYDYLHNKHMLDWKTRLSILQQVAQGLEHLHYACTPSIIHGNLKSTNVLLSGDGMLAKVSDFGIYGLSPNVDATSGYLDPEYFSMQKLTDKSDVYSFGVLILEVVCGRVPFDTSLAKDAWNIVDWARQVYDEGDYELMVDACLHGNYNTSTLSTVVQLALKATEGNINERPTMAELVVELKEASKVEVGHHVVFAEQDMSDLSNSSEAHLPSAYGEGLCEDDAPQHVKS